MKRLLYALFLLPVLALAGSDQPPYAVKDTETYEDLKEAFSQAATHTHSGSDGSAKLKTTIPATDSTYDLGASGTEWANLYVDTVTINYGAPTTPAQNAVYAEMTPKVLARVSTAQGISLSINVTSSTVLNNPGSTRINFTRPFVSSNYFVQITVQDQASPDICSFDFVTLSAGFVDVVCRNASSGALVNPVYFVAVFGKQ